MYVAAEAACDGPAYGSVKSRNVVIVFASTHGERPLTICWSERVTAAMIVHVQGQGQIINVSMQNYKYSIGYTVT